MTTVDDALVIALQAAVPLRILELLTLSKTSRRERVRVWAHRSAEAVAHRGDQLMFRTAPSKGEGGTADTFNHLAMGLAALAMAPGGVIFAGQHWCIEHRGGLLCTNMTELTCNTSGVDTLSESAAVLVEQPMIVVELPE